MKKILLILSLFLTSSVAIFAQDDDDDNGNEKVRDKMSEYIQKKLDLTDAETKKFAPVFIQYFKEWRTTLRENKGPENRLQRQQKIVELRLKFKPQFQQILGDRRGLKVYDHMDIFINELREIRQNRIRNTPGRGRG